MSRRALLAGTAAPARPEPGFRVGERRHLSARAAALRQFELSPARNQVALAAMTYLVTERWREAFPDIVFPWERDREWSRDVLNGAPGNELRYLLPREEVARRAARPWRREVRFERGNRVEVFPVTGGSIQVNGEHYVC